MTCKQCVDLLADYVEDVLPAKRRATLDRHLSLCADCTAYLESYRATIKMSAAAMRQAFRGLADGMPESMVDAILAVEAERREPPDEEN